jgi:hypothetical protein
MILTGGFSSKMNHEPSVSGERAVSEGKCARVSVLACQSRRGFRQGFPGRSTTVFEPGGVRVLPYHTAVIALCPSKFALCGGDLPPVPT